MTTKRIIIPTITMVLISSMLFGVTACSKREAYDMLQETEQIELEYAVPEYDADEESKVELLPWLQLASLETHPELRSAFEELLDITTEDDGTKNGIVYTDENGDRNQNNTLFNALGNTNFTISYIRDAEQISKIEEIANNEYTDLEDNQGVAAVINAYFEILPDQEQGQFDGDSTISRAQAMTLLMRAITPVNDQQAPETDSDFTAKVGETTYTDFAAPMNQYAYLNTSNGLTDKTFNSTMSRGEYIYMLTKCIYGDAYAQRMVDVGKTDETLSDDLSLTTIKDAGDITFQEALNNPENGLPTEMYNILARAVALGFITEGTLNWDEAITKADAIDLFIDAVENVNIECGWFVSTAGDLYELTEEDMQEENEITESINEANQADQEIASTETPAPEAPTYTVEPIDNQIMYAQQSVNLRQGPSTEYDKVGSLSTNQQVTVTGKVTMDNSIWYQLSTGEFVASKYLGTDKVAVTQKPSNPQSTNSNTSNNNNSSPSTSSSSTNDTPQPAANEEEIATSSGSGTGDGSSRANRSGSDLDWSDTAGGNLQ